MGSEFIHPIDRRDPNWISAAEESRQEINDHLEHKSRIAGPPPAPRCPYCGLVMSNREATEQGACNECSGGAYDPREYGSDETEGGY